MKKNFSDYNEMTTFINALNDENKWVMNIVKAPDDIGGYNVEWIEHKKYIAFDGKEFYDEVWLTEKGEMMLVQDMEEAHVRNAFRMLLRNRRKEAEAYSMLAAAILGGEGELPDELPLDQNDKVESADEDIALHNDSLSVKGNTTLH